MTIRDLKDMISRLEKQRGNIDDAILNVVTPDGVIFKVNLLQMLELQTDNFEIGIEESIKK